MPYAKTIWNSADIITQDRWDNIVDNLELKYLYYIPLQVETGTAPGYTPPGGATKRSSQGPTFEGYINKILMSYKNFKKVLYNYEKPYIVIENSQYGIYFKMLYVNEIGFDDYNKKVAIFDAEYQESQAGTSLDFVYGSGSGTQIQEIIK